MDSLEYPPLSSQSENASDFPPIAPSPIDSPLLPSKPAFSYSSLLKQGQTKAFSPGALSLPSSFTPPSGTACKPSSAQDGLPNITSSQNVAPEEVGYSSPEVGAPSAFESGGLKTLVVDANAIIKGVRLEQFHADEIVTISEVLSEIRDKQSRKIMETLPYDIVCLDPSVDAVKAVMRFAKETGDLHSLSPTDVKLIALAYTLEEERHGTHHLRRHPPPLIQLSSKNSLRDTNMPGWGKVDNPEEWAEIDEVRDDGTKKGEKGGRGGSRILGLTTIDLSQGVVGVAGEEDDDEMADGHQENTAKDGSTDNRGKDGDEKVHSFNSDCDKVATRDENDKGEHGDTKRGITVERERESEGGIDGINGNGKKGGGEWKTGSKKGKKKKKGIPLIKGEESFEGKITVTGVDAAKGDHDDDNDGEWERAGGKSLRRKTAKRERKKAFLLKMSAVTGSEVKETEGNVEIETGGEEKGDISLKETKNNLDDDQNLMVGSLKGLCLDCCDGDDVQQIIMKSDADKNNFSDMITPAEDKENRGKKAEGEESEGDDDAQVLEILGEDDDQYEEISQFPMENNGAADTQDECNSIEDQDVGIVGGYSGTKSEANIAINNSLPTNESSVACITSDFSMQNVILQIGLRLLSVDGLRIKKLKKFVLKCHACQAVTKEMSKIFCSSCGNGGTLNKVAIVISDDGVVLANPRRRINLRGTKYSLPLPIGGREGAEKNLILREDQLPIKFRKQSSAKKDTIDEEYATWFQGAGIKQKNEQVKVKGIIPFLSKRNPNENRIARKKR